MSADRLAELRRQRALAQEQLAWLDREIAAQSTGETTKSAGHSASPSVAPPAASVDTLMDDYRVPPAALHQDVRKGCFVYFALALAVLVIVTLGLYFALRHR